MQVCQKSKFAVTWSIQQMVEYIQFFTSQLQCCHFRDRTNSRLFHKQFSDFSGHTFGNNLHTNLRGTVS